MTFLYWYFSTWVLWLCMNIMLLHAEWTLWMDSKSHFFVHYRRVVRMMPRMGPRRGGPSHSLGPASRTTRPWPSILMAQGRYISGGWGRVTSVTPCEVTHITYRYLLSVRSFYRKHISIQCVVIRLHVCIICYFSSG